MSNTLKETVKAQIEHHETPSIPYMLSFEGDVAERLDAHYGGPAWREKLDNCIRGVPGPELVVDTSAEHTTTDPYGSVWRVDRRPFHLEVPALREPSLAGYRFPDLDRYFDAAWRERALATIAAEQGHFLTAGFGFGLFERTWTLRGFTEVLTDVAADPAFYDELVGAVAEHQMAILERLVQLPVDGILFSDDWGYQRGVLIGNERWRKHLKPRLARMYARVHNAGKYTLSHCCGNVADVVPDLIEIGLDVLESVQPEAMDPYALKAKYGNHIAFWGGLGTQGLLPFGTPEEIKREVMHLCREMGRGGGYILAPAKSLQPETPTANAAAVVESFLEQG